MNEIIKIDTTDAERPTVSGRELHEALRIGDKYSQWFSRMCEYGFEEEKDFFTILGKSTGGRPRADHALTISMAKELCMIQRTEIGRQFRQYFIQVEEAWNSPEMVMKRALDIANQRVQRLTEKVSALTVDNEIMRPKAEYFDELVDRNLLTNFRDTAKELKIGQKEFMDFLFSHGYIFRDAKGKPMPYNKYVQSGLFEVKEYVNRSTTHCGQQALITPKGRETFRLLCIGNESED